MKNEPERGKTIAFPSRLGWFALAVDGQTLMRGTFGWPSGRAALSAIGEPQYARRQPSRFERRLADRLRAFACGARDDFLDLALDVSHLTPFGRRVIQQCRRIPFGTTLTYAELADRAGSPRAARAVGNLMAHNRFPLVVPCHRVVGTAGSLGGYSAPTGLQMKRRLLQLEGALPGSSQ